MKVVKMTDPNAMASLVNKGAELCAEAEDRLAEAYKAVLALQVIPAEARTLGMIGYLESQHLVSDIRATAGKVAGARADVFAFHRTGTEVAQRHGVDLPAPRDGGGGR